VQRLAEPDDVGSIGPGWLYTSWIGWRRSSGSGRFEDWDVYYPALRDEYAAPG
jgi:hypothetical protein